jgi:hypothetical protein
MSASTEALKQIEELLREAIGQIMTAYAASRVGLAEGGCRDRRQALGRNSRGSGRFDGSRIGLVLDAAAY